MYKIEIGDHNLMPQIIKLSNIYLLLSKKMTKLEKNWSKLNVTVWRDGVTFMIFGFSLVFSNILWANKSVLKKWDQ